MFYNIIYDIILRFYDIKSMKYFWKKNTLKKENKFIYFSGEQIRNNAENNLPDIDYSNINEVRKAAQKAYEENNPTLGKEIWKKHATQKTLNNSHQEQVTIVQELPNTYKMDLPASYRKNQKTTITQDNTPNYDLPTEYATESITENNLNESLRNILYEINEHEKEVLVGSDFRGKMKPHYKRSNSFTVEALENIQRQVGAGADGKIGPNSIKKIKDTLPSYKNIPDKNNAAASIQRPNPIQGEQNERIKEINDEIAKIGAEQAKAKGLYTERYQLMSERLISNTQGTADFYHNFEKSEDGEGLIDMPLSKIFRGLRTPEERSKAINIYTENSKKIGKAIQALIEDFDNQNKLSSQEKSGITKLLTLYKVAKEIKLLTLGVIPIADIRLSGLKTLQKSIDYNKAFGLIQWIEKGAPGEFEVSEHENAATEAHHAQWKAFYEIMQVYQKPENIPKEKKNKLQKNISLIAKGYIDSQLPYDIKQAETNFNWFEKNFFDSKEYKEFKSNEQKIRNIANEKNPDASKFNEVFNAIKNIQTITKNEINEDYQFSDNSQNITDSITQRKAYTFNETQYGVEGGGINFYKNLYANIDPENGEFIITRREEDLFSEEAETTFYSSEEVSENDLNQKEKEALESLKANWQQHENKGIEAAFVSLEGLQRGQDIIGEYQKELSILKGGLQTAIDLNLIKIKTVSDAPTIIRSVDLYMKHLIKTKDYKSLQKLRPAKNEVLADIKNKNYKSTSFQEWIDALENDNKYQKYLREVWAEDSVGDLQEARKLKQGKYTEGKIDNIRQGHGFLDIEHKQGFVEAFKDLKEQIPDGGKKTSMQYVLETLNKTMAGVKGIPMSEETLLEAAKTARVINIDELDGYFINPSRKGTFKKAYKADLKSRSQTGKMVEMSHHIGNGVSVKILMRPECANGRPDPMNISINIPNNRQEIEWIQQKFPNILDGVAMADTPTFTLRANINNAGGKNNNEGDKDKGFSDDKGKGNASSSNEIAISGEGGNSGNGGGAIDTLLGGGGGNNSGSSSGATKGLLEEIF